VELGRKLILSGLIGLVGRGSIAQSALATMISFGFCAISFREQPFKKPTLNHVKIFSEFQIFVVLLVCLIVQVHEQGFEAELVSIDAYGAIQTIAVIAIIPMVFYFLVRTFRDVKAEVKEDRDHGGMMWRDDFHHDHNHEHGHGTPDEHDSDDGKALRATNRPVDGINPSASRSTTSPSRPTTGLREPPPLHDLSASTATTPQPQSAAGALREPPSLSDLAKARRP
jgi:hypothetical protein